jgi:hypothetical protein
MTDERSDHDRYDQQAFPEGQPAGDQQVRTEGDTEIRRAFRALEAEREQARARDAAPAAAAPLSTAGVDRALAWQATQDRQRTASDDDRLAALLAEFEGHLKATPPAQAELEARAQEPGAQKLRTLAPHLEGWVRQAQAYQGSQIPAMAENAVTRAREVLVYLYGISRGEAALPSGAEQLEQCRRRLLSVRAADVAALPHDFRSTLREQWTQALAIPRAAADALRLALAAFNDVDAAIVRHAQAGRPVATLHDGARAPEVTPELQRFAQSVTARQEA